MRAGHMASAAANRDRADVQAGLFTVTPSPHMFGRASTSMIMWSVIAALLPGLAAGAWLFGPRVLLVAGATVAACVISEYAARRAMTRPQTVGDLSAAVTGLLLAMCLPPTIELWKAAVGGAFAIVVVKQVFGGIGQNFMNPALAARIALLTSWGQSMTSWTAPSRFIFASFSPAAKAAATATAAVTATAAAASGVDAVSAATPMALAKALFQAGAAAAQAGAGAGAGQALSGAGQALSGAGQALSGAGVGAGVGAGAGVSTLPSYIDMFLGNIAGCIGEASAAALLVGAMLLLALKVITWHIPATYIATVAALAWAFGGTQGLFTGDPLYHVLGGGLMLGAFFMATDYSTSPMTRKGKVIMGVGCGALTACIRLFAGYPEGVAFAILVMNVATPLIDRYTKPMPFGATKKRRRE